jgi:hypothetical protein
MNQTSVQGPTKLRLILAAVIILSATIFAFGGQSPAEAAVVNKITICHRTHSTTNPYRRITVAVAAISKNNGHGDEGASNTHNKGTGVFDPTYSYPPNAKLWNDIIPDETNGGTALLAYNYSGAGVAIYNGTSFDGYDYAGLALAGLLVMPRNKKTRANADKSTINRESSTSTRPTPTKNDSRTDERPLFLVETDVDLPEDADEIVEAGETHGSKTPDSSGSSFEEIWNIAKEFNPETKAESSRKTDMKIAYVLGIILGVALLVIFGRKGRGSRN